MHAHGAEPGLTLPAQDLAEALRKLGDQAHLELLFDPARMAGLRSAPVRGAANPDAALSQMLAGTGFIARHGDRAVLLIVPAPPAEQATLGTGQSIPAVAELLVTGSRSLNAAIRRSEDDIQPYAVFSSEALAASQSQTVEEFLRTRDPDNAQAGSLAQVPVANGGAVRSSVNLGGLGTAQTLVLVDGRRLPSIPGLDVFQQGDLNGIPPAAIERIETLTSTAGGIYGPGATGGVVNVVLKHDYSGGELDLGGGGSTRGDAPHWRVDADWGHSFRGGDTQVSLALSHAEDAGLIQGQRDIAVEARQQQFANGYVSGLPVSQSLNVLAADPAPGLFQSTSAGSRTYKPLNLPLASGGLAALGANQGKLDLSLSPDGQGTMQSLLSRIRSNAVLLDLRQVVTPRIDLFVDALYFQDQGVATGPRTDPTVLTVDNDAVLGDYSRVSFPTPGLSADSASEDETLRVTAGGIFRFGGGWNGEADLTWGRASETTRTPILGSVGQGELVTDSIDILDSGAGIASLVPSFEPDTATKQVNQMLDASLRFSGPVATLPGGALTMTVLGEFRRESEPNAFGYQDNAFSDSPQVQSVGSAYAELRAPLLPRDFAVLPLRGLELQFAGRSDSETDVAPADSIEYTGAGPAGSEPFKGHADTFAFTAGLRVFPLDGLMLRASVATGFLPPTPADLLEGVFSTATMPIGYVPDPRRGNTLVGSTTAVTYEVHGSPDLQPERARTISAGLVATPAWTPGLRLSLDYTRIDKTHEITDFADFDFDYFLDNEAQYASRITRAPLTAADIAQSYTGGVVTNIDDTTLSIGRSTVQTVDLDASYERDTALGRLRFYTRATWEPDYSREDDPRQGMYQTAGHIGGPLTLRGNGGLNWSRGRWSAGLNVQAYGAYSVIYTDRTEALRTQTYSNLLTQHVPIIPAQAYADIQVAYRQALPGAWGVRSLEYRVGLHNIADTQPPLLLVAPSAVQPAQSLYYSPYGDPRGRRIDVSLISRF